MEGECGTLERNGTPEQAEHNKAFKLWISGKSYREIQKEVPIGLATIHRTIQKWKEREPDIPKLRQLNIALQKSGLTLADAIRACSMLSRLDQLGVGINELSEYVELSKKLVATQGVGAAELVESALKLSKLEKETGKPYHEVVREFEGKQARVKELDLKVKELDSERVKIQGELGQAKEKLSKTLEELKQAIGMKERLQRLGLEKTAALAEFIEDYEMLGFDAREVQKLAEWRKSLAKMGIDPDRLETFIRERGTLKKQLQEVDAELTQGKARLKILTKMEKDLQRRVDDIQRIERILQGRKSSFGCSYCRGITFHEVRRFEVQMALSCGQPLTVVCQHCGTPNPYDPHTLLLNLGLEILS